MIPRDQDGNPLVDDNERCPVCGKYEQTSTGGLLQHIRVKAGMGCLKHRQWLEEHKK